MKRKEKSMTYKSLLCHWTFCGEVYKSHSAILMHMNDINMQPKLYNEKLSEFIGILLGDGSLSLRGYNNSIQNRIKISLNAIDDIEYSHYINNLIYELFTITPLIRKRRYENTLDILIFDRILVSFLIKKLGLKVAPKWNRGIISLDFTIYPYDLRVIKGYFDTDGSLVITNNNGIIYPRLEMKVSPSPMQIQFIEILKKHNFRFGFYKIGKGMIRIQLNGKGQVKKWVDLVGFSNPKHIKKSKKFL